MTNSSHQPPTFLSLQNISGARNDDDRAQIIENGEENPVNFSSNISPSLGKRICNSFSKLMMCGSIWKPIGIISFICTIIMAIVLIRQELKQEIHHNSHHLLPHLSAIVQQIHNSSTRPEVSSHDLEDKPDGFSPNNSSLKEDEQDKLASLELKVQKLNESKKKMSTDITLLTRRLDDLGAQTGESFTRLFKETNLTLCSENGKNISVIVGGVVRLSISVRFRPNSVIPPDTELFRLERNNSTILNGGSVRARLINKNKKVKCVPKDPRPETECQMLEEIVLVSSHPGDVFTVTDFLSGNYGVVEYLSFCMNQAILATLPAGVDSLVVTH